MPIFNIDNFSDLLKLHSDKAISNDYLIHEEDSESDESSKILYDLTSQRKMNTLPALSHS